MIALSPDQFIPLRLRQRFQQNKTTHVFSFDLPHPTSQAGLLAGQYVAVRAFLDGKDEIRYYSPISRNSDFGKIDLLIKVCVIHFKYYYFFNTFRLNLKKPTLKGVWLVT